MTAGERARFRKESFGWAVGRNEARDRKSVAAEIVRKSKREGESENLGMDKGNEIVEATARF